MQFLVCLAAMVAVASAGLSSVTYHGSYAHGLGYGYGGYGGYGHGYGYAPVVKAIAPVATSYANVNSVHLGQHVIARPVAHGYYGAAPIALGHGLGYGGYGHGAVSYASTSYGLPYGHGYGSGYGYKAYHY